MLPIFQTDNKELSLMQTRWAQEINPLLSNSLSSSRIVSGIVLASGDNTINHKLGRKLIGWIVVGMSGGFVQLYDKQSTNLMADRTLVIHSSGVATITLAVF